MYMVTLLMVIASLTLVECYSTKSEIRFGYGLLSEHRGQIPYGLNKYHLLVGVEMPKFTFTQYCYQLEQHLNCGQSINMTILHKRCRFEPWPVLLFSLSYLLVKIIYYYFIS